MPLTKGKNSIAINIQDPGDALSPQVLDQNQRILRSSRKTTEIMAPLRPKRPHKAVSVWAYGNGMFMPYKLAKRVGMAKYRGLDVSDVQKQKNV